MTDGWRLTPEELRAIVAEQEAANPGDSLALAEAVAYNAQQQLMDYLQTESISVPDPVYQLIPIEIWEAIYKEL